MIIKTELIEMVFIGEDNPQELVSAMCSWVEESVERLLSAHIGESKKMLMGTPLMKIMSGIPGEEIQSHKVESEAFYRAGSISVKCTITTDGPGGTVNREFYDMATKSALLYAIPKVAEIMTGKSGT